MGELLCDSLVNAEDAATLSFVLLEGERVVADQTSYTVTDGDAFSDGIGRRVGPQYMLVWTEILQVDGTYTECTGRRQKFLFELFLGIFVNIRIGRDSNEIRRYSYI